MKDLPQTTVETFRLPLSVAVLPQPEALTTMLHDVLDDCYKILRVAIVEIEGSMDNGGSTSYRLWCEGVYQRYSR